MRTPLLVLSMLLLVSASLIAGPDEQVEKIDTLIIEPREAGDLPEPVVAWLEARNLLIPRYGEYGYSQRYGNTLIGSFLGDNTKDCAVLTIPRGALEDSCSIWVFPSGDTLAPMLISKRGIYGPYGSQWPLIFEESLALEYAWCIRPYGPYSAEDLQRMRVDTTEFPKMTHQGIFILLAEKDPGPFYYYNGTEWLLLPLGQ